MSTVTKLAAIPDGSGVLDGFGEVHFWDSCRVAARTDRTAAEVMREIMILPRRVAALLRLRNAIVGMLGLKTGGAEAAFPMISQTENEVVTGLSDKHLNFRASVIKTPTTVSLTTVVHFNNAWGRLYFLLSSRSTKLLMTTRTYT